MDFEYFDIHSHLHFPDFDSDRDDIISEMNKNKIATIVIGTDEETSKQSLGLAKSHKNIFSSVGQHPGDVTSKSDFQREIISFAKSEEVVAIGECGLDYFRLSAQSGEDDISKQDESIIKNRQKKIFEEQIKLSIETSKPLMLHIRPSNKTMDAYFDSLDILKSYSKEFGERISGNVHFFAGDMDVMKNFLDIGFYVSFTGVITFTRNYDEFVKYPPVEMIMAETDCPFVAPVPYRGQKNSPLYIPLVVKKIAEIREENFEEIKENMVKNALKIFKIKG